MKTILTWALGAAGITIACLAVFVFAAWLFPGDPGRFYLWLGVASLMAAVAGRYLQSCNSGESDIEYHNDS